MKRILVTFGDGSCVYRAAGRRLAFQAKQSKLFDEIVRFDLNKLRLHMPEQWAAHKKFLLDPTKKRGRGYWLWKPMILDYCINRLNNGDTLFYCDAGCELNLAYADSMDKVWPETDIDAVFFDGRVDDQTTWTMREWTNRYAIEAIDPNASILDKPQIVGGAILFRVSDVTREIIKEWLHWATWNEYGLLIDRDEEGEPDSFIEHRHDQALLSLVVYKACFHLKLVAKMLPAGLIECPSKFFIEARRNASGISLAGDLRFVFFMRLYYLLCRKLKLDFLYLKALSFI